jgi:hypothetical protein
MFDTLMQMGRWFGYRPRYADLCRVYTTCDLYGAFREIALAIDDLRGDLERMALASRTPEEFGLRVRTPSDGLLITAANKLRRGETVQVRFAGEHVQALQIPSEGPAAQKNRDALDRLVRKLPAPAKAIRGDLSPHFIWHDVPAAEVVEFLTSYDAYRTHSFLNHCEQLRRYIQDRLSQQELVTWTVCLISVRPGPNVSRATIGSLDVPLNARGPDKVKSVPPTQFVMRGVTGSKDESVDLSAIEYEAAVKLTQDLERRSGKQEAELSRLPAREEARSVRPPSRGLLLIYPIKHPSGDAANYLVSAAVSFPNSPTAAPLIYTVNDIWQAEYGFAGDWDENGQLT